MNQQAQSIRAFIGSKDFEESRNFYTDLGFQEFIISHNLSYFSINKALGFYLQNAYVKDWVDNTMIFVEVEALEKYYDTIKALELNTKYKSIKLLPIVINDWGKEFFLHDPSGILWHFGKFNFSG